MSKKDDVQQNINNKELEKLQAELEELKLQSNTLDNQLKRAVADYQNLEKRVVEGRGELATWATAELIKKMLPVVDSFNRAISGASEDDRKSGWFKGVEMALKQLQQVLKEEGLDEIVADGQFDPSLHEAIDSKEGEEGQVLEVAAKGYTLNGKIIRPASVVVGRKEIERN